MKLVVIIIFVVALAAGYLTTGVVVIQPIGALPEGMTIWMWRLKGSPFIESPDAWCWRNDSPNLLCRGVFLAALGNNKDAILLRLPYSSSLEALARP